MLGERELDDEPVDIGVAVELGHAVEKLVLGHVVLEADERRLEAALLAGDDLVFHVGLRTTVVAHQHGGQVGALLPRGHHLFHFFGYFGFYGRGRGFAVNKCHNISF